MPRLEDLPNELLTQIICEFDCAATLAYFSLTCKKFHALVLSDGYRAFARSHFPTIYLADISDVSEEHRSPIFWKDLIHAKTTMSRNWERRAMMAKILWHHTRQTGTRTRQRGVQSMGCVPVIDSHQYWPGGDWTSRRDILTWGAGPLLILRSYAFESENKNEADMRPPDVHWHPYHAAEFQEGRDDITSLHLVRPNSQRSEQCIVGRASGLVERVGFGDGPSLRQLNTLDTGERIVRSSTINNTEDLFVACLSDKAVTAYHLGSGEDPDSKVSEIAITGHRERLRTWTCKFLSKERVAIGVGTAAKPIQVVDVDQSGFRSQVRHIALGKEVATNIASPSTAVYAIAPLPHSSGSSDVPGDLFLSGAYDGITRLHDLRQPSTVVSHFADPTDAGSAIYSLLPIDRDRFVAGTAYHCLIKVFDLRMPHTHPYSSVNSTVQRPRKRTVRREKAITGDLLGPKRKYLRVGGDYNVFLSSRPPIGWDIMSNRGPSPESPVYSLSRPSALSPSFYAGIENNVMQIDMLSVTDAHPDPFHARHGTIPTQCFEVPSATVTDPVQHLMDSAPVSSYPTGGWLAPHAGGARGLFTRTTQRVQHEATTQGMQGSPERMKWDYFYESARLSMYDQQDETGQRAGSMKLQHQGPVWAPRKRDYKRVIADRKCTKDDWEWDQIEMATEGWVEADERWTDG